MIETVTGGFGSMVMDNANGYGQYKWSWTILGTGHNDNPLTLVNQLAIDIRVA
jgi:hypothetical protein